ncbi:hypothetical protein LJC18_01015 [Lachnospiraceae bacterium OttesenSCG-928-E19]|nr:hypothetical protein [Lachnospiraceae bacterium OttesenSCG-928-E19]
MKKTLLMCTGLSGSGKSYFIENYLPNGLFHMLIVGTTRPQRPGEIEGIDRYYMTEEYFTENKDKFITWSWINEFMWKDGDPKWMYGVPEFEVNKNNDKNLVYDIIEPKYIRQMIDWFKLHGLDQEYDFKIAWFLPPENNFDTVRARANMPNDEDVRRHNTCDAIDFLRAGIYPDYILKCSAEEVILDQRLIQHIEQLHKQ